MLVDSTYERKECQYPISIYMINYFNFEYILEEHKDANDFYKEILKTSYFNKLI